MRILFLINHDIGLYCFRLELIECLLRNGYEVYISSPYGERIESLVKMGCHFIETPVDRHGTNPVNDVELLLRYRALLRKYTPNIVLTYTIKPNIYGGLACRITKTSQIANITGLGNAIEHGGAMQWFVEHMYRLSLKKTSCLFFQNESNREYFKKNGLYEGYTRLVSGSGVNLARFSYAPYPPDTQYSFLFSGRFIREKGIYELLDAATIVKKKYPQIDTALIGFADEPGAQAHIDAAVKKGVVRFLGEQSDVRPYLRRCHALILPSYHEGMSNALIEAAAMGRPIIATDIPGCRETFDEGVSGLGVKPMDADDLAKKMCTFIELPYEKKREMGLEGRKKMEREFDRDLVVEAYMEEIKKVTRN